MTYRVAFIGTGPEPENPVWGESAAMAYHHAPGYRERDDCEIVACADIVRENADAFATEFDIPDDHIYEDYLAMLAEAEPDIVSIATPVPTHAPIVLDCLREGDLAAIHCEKPMATTWGDARQMAQAANRRDVQLTFNHQRRFSPVFRKPYDLIQAGDIGDLRRVEIATRELLDNGTHYLDLAGLYTGERAPSWVLGNIDYREEHIKYGAHNANQAVAQWAYDGGIHGLAVTGHGDETDLVGATMRLVGTAGEITVEPYVDEQVRVRRDGEGWEGIAIETPDGAAPVTPAIHHVVECVNEGIEPELSARRALNATEIIFATYESSRRRGRVDLPLEIEDNPLAAMVESGAVHPTPADD